jgi:tol-pal system protein YbgF
MFRQPPLPRACLSLALGLGLGFGLWTVPARGQDRSAYERLDRLERDLNMLQRHVYRGAPAPMADSGVALNAQLRMDRLETQMRELIGRVEEFMNQVEQVRQRVDQLSSDAELRVTQGPGGPGPLASAGPLGRSGAGAGRPGRPPPVSEPPGRHEDELAAVRPGAPGQLVPPGVPPPGFPTPMFGTLTPPGAAPPPELASAAPAGRPPARGALPSGSTAEQYNYAMGLLKQANYQAAEAALKAFIAQHPKDPMAGSAQYFLGDIHYQRREYAEAAGAFAEGYKRFPKGPKAAESLLKLSMSLAQANRKQDACTALARLDQEFQNLGASVKERAAAEKRRLGC